MPIKSISELKQIERRKKEKKNTNKNKIKDKGNNHSLNRFCQKNHGQNRGGRNEF